MWRRWVPAQLGECDVSSVTVASTPAVTFAPTCAFTPWTSHSSAASATAASANHPHCATMFACTLGSGLTSARSAKVPTPSWPACGPIRRAPDTGPPTAPCSRIRLPCLSHTPPPWLTISPPWCCDAILWAVLADCLEPTHQHVGKGLRDSRWDRPQWLLATTAKSSLHVQGQ